MAEDERGMEAVANALERLSDRIDDALRGGGKRGKRRREEEDDAPESALEMRRGRRDPLEIQGVLFEVSVPVGRRGEMMRAHLLFPPVRDERDLEKLADEVEREFRNAKILPPKEQFRGFGNGYGNSYRGGYGGYNGYRDRGYYDRGYDRDWQR